MESDGSAERIFLRQLQTCDEGTTPEEEFMLTQRDLNAYDLDDSFIDDSDLAPPQVPLVRVSLHAAHPCTLC